MSTVRAATQIIVPLLLVSPVISAGESMPVLIKPSKPIRVDSHRTEFSVPQNAKAIGRKTTVPAGDQLRELLDLPDETTSEPGQVGRTQVNRFVDLTDPPRRSNSSVPSVELPSRQSSESSGAVRTNALVADTPPKLRRFTPAQRSAIARQHRDEIRGLVAKEVTMPARPFEGLDQAFDALKTNASSTTDPLPIDNETLRSAARHDGFGMLALDQIGDHLTLQPANNSAEPSSAVAHDLRQFLQGPPPQPTLTDSTPVRGPVESPITDTRPKSAEVKTPHADIPLLPPPVRRDVMVSNRSSATSKTMPSPFHFDPDGKQPKDVDELLETSSGTSNASDTGSLTSEKRGLFSVLFPRNNQGGNSQSSESQSSSTQRRKRGILGRLLK